MRFLLGRLLIVSLVANGTSATFALAPAPSATPADASPSEEPEAGKVEAEDPPLEPPEVATTTPNKGDASDADRVLRLQKIVDADKEQLEKLRADLEEQNLEYEQAHEVLDDFATQIEEQKEQLQKLTDDAKAEEAAALDKKIQPLQLELDLATRGLDLLIQSRETLQKQIANLEEKTDRDEKSLASLKGESEPQEPGGKPDKPVSDPAPDQRASGDSGDAPTSGENADAPPDEKDKSQAPTSEHVVRAIDETKEKEEEAHEAWQEVVDLAERIVRLEKDIELEQESLANVNERIEHFKEMLQQQQKTLQQKLESGAPGAEIDALQEKVSETRTSLNEAQSEFQAKNDRIDDLRLLLHQHKAEKVKIEETAAAKTEEAEAAKFSELVVTVREGIAHWIRYSGPKVLLALGIALAIWLLTRLLFRGLVWLTRVLGRRVGVTRLIRLTTLLQMMGSGLGVAIILGGVLVTLKIAGIPIGPLLGSAAVVGLAVAFAAQDIIRDYFHGVIIMLENQYTLNDEVTLNELSGKVEVITLRLTVLRDFEGSTHFIPNGQITTVTNKSHLWSRAIVEVEINANEDMDEMNDLLVDVVKRLKDDTKFGRFVIGEPEMLGINEIGESSLTLKLGVKTQPGKNNDVKYELLRRIKNAFDELAAHRDTDESAAILVSSG